MGALADTVPQIDHLQSSVKEPLCQQASSPAASLSSSYSSFRRVPGLRIYQALQVYFFLCLSLDFLPCHHHVILIAIVNVNHVAIVNVILSYPLLWNCHHRHHRYGIVVIMAVIIVAVIIVAVIIVAVISIE